MLLSAKESVIKNEFSSESMAHTIVQTESPGVKENRKDTEVDTGMYTVHTLAV